MCNSFSKICEWIRGELLFILATQFWPRWGKHKPSHNADAAWETAGLQDGTSNLLITGATVLQPQLINNVA